MLEKEDEALYAWAFGWATKTIFKEKGRIKIKVSAEFERANPRLGIENRVFDVFKEDLGQILNLIKIFDNFKKNAALLTDINEQLSAIENKSSKDYLVMISSAFARSSNTDVNQRFRTEKKSYNLLSPAEKELLNNKEEKKIIERCTEIANASGVKVEFPEEKIGSNYYTRMTVL